MRVAQIGLDSMYWPVVWADALGAGVKTASQSAGGAGAPRLVAVTSLGVAPHAVQMEIGRTPDEFAAGYHVPHYATLDALLAAEAIDAALVATRNTRMPEVAGRLVDAGVPCYIAKPIAASPADAMLLAEQAEKRGVPCTAGPTTRGFPRFHAVGRAVRKHRIGPPVSISVMHQHGSFAAWPARTWYREPHEGGVAYWLGWYPLETVRWLAGGPIETIAAVGRDVTGTVRGEREVIVASGCTQNGVPFSVRVYFAAGLDWRFPMHEVEVFGREGVVRTLDAERIEVYDGKGRHEERVDTPPGDPVQREVLNWLRSLRGQAVWHPTLKELAHTVTACEALRRALVTGEPARV